MSVEVESQGSQENDAVQADPFDPPFDPCPRVFPTLWRSPVFSDEERDRHGVDAMQLKNKLETMRRFCSSRQGIGIILAIISIGCSLIALSLRGK
jgi:hypothetical protein